MVLEKTLVVGLGMSVYFRFVLEAPHLTEALKGAPDGTTRATTGRQPV
jgi:hypothetical protein